MLCQLMKNNFYFTTKKALIYRKTSIFGFPKAFVKQTIKHQTPLKMVKL